MDRLYDLLSLLALALYIAAVTLLALGTGPFLGVRP